MCYNGLMKAYIHARLGREDRASLEELKATTGQTESEIVRRGLQLVALEERRRRSALDLAGPSVGRFKKGPRDLSTNQKHFDGFGEANLLGALLQARSWPCCRKTTRITTGRGGCSPRYAAVPVL